MKKSASLVRFKSNRPSSRADLNLLAESDAQEAVARLDSSDGVVNDDGFHNFPIGIKLMYAANEGDLMFIRELLASGTDVNFSDVDQRTPLHVAACQGYKEVVELLIQNGAEVEAKDRWGSTPLADAIYYKNYGVVKFLEKNGAVPMMPPMHVKNLHDVPEYEIHPQEIDFTNSINITKGTFRKALWRGIEVAVKQVGDDVFGDEDKVRAFRDELALLQRVRHPNVVQFLGAVTQSSPMMIITEYLPKGDLCHYLKSKGHLTPRKAVRFALDIARGISCLHENKPLPIIHLDLEPSNILLDDSGSLKIADFGVSKLLKVAKGAVDEPLKREDTTCRYMPPELFRNEVYNTKVDVFSFGLILQEMIEGCPPFFEKNESEVPQLYSNKHRPPFRASTKLYAHGLQELIEKCWSENPNERPTFREIITKLGHIYNKIGRKRRWKVPSLSSLFRSLWILIVECCF